MKAVISLAVRDRSSRLPSKWRAEVAGKPILQLIIERLQRSKAEVVISNNENDEPILILAEQMGVRYVGGGYRNGPTYQGVTAIACPDMMAMHAKTARETDADVLCLAGADDPFLDPAIFDMCVDRISRGDVAMVKTAGWPLGLNVWAMTREAMEDGDREATAPDERQHVVPFWERRPKRYPIAVLHRAGEDLYDRFRVTIDGPSDLELTRAVYDSLGFLWGPGNAFDPLDTRFTAEHVISFLELRPEIAALNADGLHGYAARDAIYDIRPIDGSFSEVRAHVAIERRAVDAAMPEAPEWNAGRAAALLSLDQWLYYRERHG